ncbi:MAG: metal-dependent hydrolase [Planctomycetales bacterium]|nr:metal-dependent hydrolase [Planctomycetales bacterium]
MAGFKTHITTSSLLGVGYTGVGLHLGMPLDSSLIAGGLCGIGGMLPDIDSDSGIPFRESMGFAAAIVPMLLLDRLQQLGLNYEQLVLATGGLYLFVRFGVARMLARYTVHRGMFHSLPAAAVFTGAAFLLSGTSDLQLRYFKAGGVLLGVMSHLLLDEIYAIDWKRARLKKSFGTALKLWGPDWLGNLSTYGKLLIIVLMILGEPAVMQRYGQLSPVVLEREDWAGRIVQQTPEQLAPQDKNSPTPNDPDEPTAPGKDRTIYDTAQRIWRSLRE